MGATGRNLALVEYRYETCNWSAPVMGPDVVGGRSGLVVRGVQGDDNVQQAVEIFGAQGRLEDHMRWHPQPGIRGLLGRREHWNSFYIVVGFHNAVIRGEGDDAELLRRQPDWYHRDSFLPSIKKMCLFSNINERGVYHCTVRDGGISGCGMAERDYVWNANVEPGSPCNDIDNDPGDGCSADCRVEANADGDIFFEPPPDSWLDHAGDIYDPLNAYDQCISRNPAVDCADLDGDGVLGIRDNCPDTDNPQQLDFDGDGVGDACDPDYDNDSIPNAEDICPYAHNYMLHRSYQQTPNSYRLHAWKAAVAVRPTQM